jgi:ATP-dependent Clp protease adaptor protein ClpS
MSNTKLDSLVRPKIEPRDNIKEPYQYKVIYINDEVTTYEFVVSTLTDIFHYDEFQADELTLKIHEEGSAVVAIMPYELAEQKGVEVTMLARTNGYPLQVKIEADK